MPQFINLKKKVVCRVIENTACILKKPFTIYPKNHYAYGISPNSQKQTSQCVCDCV